MQQAIDAAEEALRTNPQLRWRTGWRRSGSRSVPRRDCKRCCESAAADWISRRDRGSGQIAQIFAHYFGADVAPSDTLKTLHLLSAPPE
jgi:hypothetical protein